MRLTNLKSHLDPQLLPLIAQWLKPYTVRVVLTRVRLSKHGDFRPGRYGTPCVITLNENLKPFQFLLTLTHEIAHLMVWHQFGATVKPHGKAWRQCFGKLLQTLATEPCLPKCFRVAIDEHARRPSSSSARDLKLMRVIRTLENADIVWLSDLDVGDRFQFRGHPFVKLKDNRTRCKCRHLISNALYHVSKTAEVERLE